MDVGVAGTVKHATRREEQAVLGKLETVSQEDEEQSSEDQQVRPGGRRHGRPARRHPNAAFDKIHEYGADRRSNGRYHREVIKEPPERKLKEVKAQVDVEQRVFGAGGAAVHGEQIVLRVQHRPLADEIADQEHSNPDSPAKK